MRKRILKITGWVFAILAGLTIAAWFAFVPSTREPEYVLVNSWGTKGSANGQFDDPTGIAVTKDEVFVADARNNRIQVFDHDGRFLRSFGKEGKNPGELGRPMNLAIRNGELYVSEYFNDRIQVFALDGTPQRIIGKAGSGPGEFNAPGGVAVDPDGSMYVADFHNHRVQKLEADGSFLRQWGQASDETHDFNAGSFNGGREDSDGVSFSYPTDVALAPDGDLYVADGYNDRVQVFKPDGTFSHKWGGPFAMNISGPFNGWFATVTSIAIGPKGNVFVADFYNHRVQKFAPDGTFLTSFGNRGSKEQQLNYPLSVAIASDGTVFVTDYGNNRVTKWSPK